MFSWFKNKSKKLKSSYDSLVNFQTPNLLKRLIYLGGEINDELCNKVVSQMLYLDAEDNSKPIYLKINSTGGSVTNALAISDTIEYVKSDVVTICQSVSGGIATLLLSGGKKGSRFSTIPATIQLGEVSYERYESGTPTDAQKREIEKICYLIDKRLCEYTGQPIQMIKKIKNKSRIGPWEAIEYGLIDQILKSNTELYQYISHKKDFKYGK